MQEPNLEIHYDKVADFLEIFIGQPLDCLSEEIEEGIFVRKDEESNQIKSIEIFGFKKRTQELGKILEKIGVKIPLKISSL